MSTIASSLEGKTLNGWVVETKLTTKAGLKGYFSSGYRVRHIDGRIAFMKAINIGYSMAHNSGSNLVDLLNEMTDDFRHERDLVEICGSGHFDRIVIGIDSGEYHEAGDPYFVPYLIFELAEHGDVRQHPGMIDHKLSWRLQVFHGAAVGLQQLHAQQVTHQDLKLANLLVFGKDGRLPIGKLSDLGRANQKGQARFGGSRHFGDISCAPIEFLYGYSYTDWEKKRAADFYMLGQVLGFLVADVQLVGLALIKLSPGFHPARWRGGLTAAIPALRTATLDAIDQIAAGIPTEVRADVKNLLTWLCEPDPERRGHPNTLPPATDRYSIERIVTVADRIRTAARIAAI